MTSSSSAATAQLADRGPDVCSAARRGASIAFLAVARDRQAHRARPPQHVDARRFFEKAIRFSATHVRVGTAIFGSHGGGPARRRQKLITPGRVLALGGDLMPSWTAPAIPVPKSKLIVSASMGLGGLLSGRVRKRNVPPRIAVHQRAPCEPLRPRQPRAAVAGHIRSVRGAGEAPLGAVVIGTVAADA